MRARIAGIAVAWVGLVAGTEAQSLQWSEGGGYASNSFASALGIAGDVNGDGVDDIIVGDFNASPTIFHDGQARVLSGVDGSILYLIDGQVGLAGVGNSVDGAGDVDGDGYADFVVGAIDVAPVLYSGVDGSVLHVLDAHGLPYSGGVSRAGDVNGDGVPDVIVGARSHSVPGLSQAGRAFVYSGAFIVDGTPPEILHTLDGVDVSGDFGAAVSEAGDVDGDGYDDVLVGAPGEDGVFDSQAYCGAAHTFSGQTGLVIHTHRFFGACSQHASSVAGVGDLDSDGYAEVIVGARFSDENGTNSGSARVYAGATGDVMYELRGNDAGDFFGWSVCGVGDADGDGVPDLLVGAVADEGGGSAWLYSGLTGGFRAFLAESGGSYGSAVAGLVEGATLDGDPYGDFAVGAPNLGGGGGQAYAYTANCTGGNVAYCQSLANSYNASGGSIFASGSLSVSAQNLILIARSCPPGNTGLFFYGETQIQEPFGDGFRCAGGATFRLNPTVVIGPDGIVQITVDWGPYPVGEGPGTILPGSTWNFSFWFRDPGGPGGSGFNLTDGRSLTFCP